jgi:hypothetical protein
VGGVAEGGVDGDGVVCTSPALGVRAGCDCAIAPGACSARDAASAEPTIAAAATDLPLPNTVRASHERRNLQWSAIIEAVLKYLQPATAAERTLINDLVAHLWFRQGRPEPRSACTAHVWF